MIKEGMNRLFTDANEIHDTDGTSTRGDSPILRMGYNIWDPWRR